jgi:predicted ATP-binding protein involved in virulence
MTKLVVKNFGQIVEAEVEFGDLTVLVGPQATGKSIFLQLFKLMADAGYIKAELKKYGIDWSYDVNQLFSVYLGEGMQNAWKGKNTSIAYNNKTIDLTLFVKNVKSKQESTFFYIPAQRVMTLTNGWPRPFQGYDSGDPFTVRNYSEQLRQIMEQSFNSGAVFPQNYRLRKEFRESLSRSVFGGMNLKVDKSRPQKRLVLSSGDGNTADLPYMVWSAGQREFMPLLLGFYWLMPPSSTTLRNQLKWVVVEELEMGLHPDAIVSVLALVMDLIHRGYKVCLSTHSTNVLDLVWGIKTIQKHSNQANDFLKLFGLSKTSPLRSMANEVLKKVFRVWYFERDSGMTKDISNLDLWSDDIGEADWGGLTEFSRNIGNVVADVVANANHSGKE